MGSFQPPQPKMWPPNTLSDAKDSEVEHASRLQFAFLRKPEARATLFRLALFGVFGESLLSCKTFAQAATTFMDSSTNLTNFRFLRWQPLYLFQFVSIRGR